MSNESSCRIRPRFPSTDTPVTGRGFPYGCRRYVISTSAPSPGGGGSPHRTALSLRSALAHRGVSGIFYGWDGDQR